MSTLKIDDTAAAGHRLRTLREETYLRLVRMMHHHILDFDLALSDKVVAKEFWRLMKLAKATTKDL